MGRGPGAVTLAALPPARAWKQRRDQRRAREKAVHGSQCGSLKRQGSPGLAMLRRLGGRGSLFTGAHSRSPARARGLQVHFGAGSFLCAPSRAPGVCAPCRRRGAAA